MSRFFKELLEVRADRWRYMFGVGSFWSIFIPLIIVAALVANTIMTSKHQYTSDDLSESYCEGYNQACDDRTEDYNDGYTSGYNAAYDDAVSFWYEEGYYNGYDDAKDNQPRDPSSHY